MAKFIVTLVVETDRDRKAPSKKTIKNAIQDYLGIDGTVWIESTPKIYLQTKVRVRSVDLD